jgi:hypothetical protein
MLNECCLQRMQGVTLREPFSRRDGYTVAGGSQGQAKPHSPPIDEHGARAARTVIAPLLGASQVEPLAQQIKQRGSHVHRDGPLCPVHCYLIDSS